MSLEHFFQKKVVFTKDEFMKFIEKNLNSDPKNYYLLLNYYSKRGRILKVRNNLYSVVPLDTKKENYMPKSYLIAGKVTNDSVLSYSSAMEYYGVTYSLLNLRTFFTSKKIKPFYFKDIYYKPIKFNSNLLKKGKERIFVEKVDIKGEFIFITSKERTFVDMLDKPNYCGGIDEVWRSIELFDFLDLSNVMDYLLLLDNSTTSAKVGFFLERNQKRLEVSESVLEQLLEMKPKSIHYIDRNNRVNAKIIKKWNLAMPKYLLEAGEVYQ
ncbi:MAG: type IV toxin-antitoxin system AbiEi family antitoxin domain-containing protein [Petrotogales bacterium]